MWVLEQQQRKAPLPALERLLMLHVPVGKFWVGRKQAKGGQELSIVIEDKSVSKTHGWVRVKRVGADEILEVQDEKSSFGTLVNSEQILAFRPKRLEEGDLVTFGNRHGKADFKARKLTLLGYCDSADEIERLSKIAEAVDEGHEWPTHAILKGACRSAWMLRCALHNTKFVRPSWLASVLGRSLLSDPLPGVSEHWVDDAPTGSEIRQHAASVLSGCALLSRQDNHLTHLARDLSDDVYEEVDHVPASIKSVAALDYGHGTAIPCLDLIDVIIRRTEIETVALAKVRSPVLSDQERDEDDRTCDEEEESAKNSVPVESDWITCGDEDIMATDEKDGIGTLSVVELASQNSLLFDNKPSKPADTRAADNLIVAAPSKKRDFRRFKKKCVNRAPIVVTDLVAVAPKETQAERELRLQAEEERRQRDILDAQLDDDGDRRQAKKARRTRR